MPTVGAREDAKFTNRMYKNWFHTSRLFSQIKNIKGGGEYSENEKDTFQNVSMERAGLEPHILSPRGKKEFVVPYLNESKGCSQSPWRDLIFTMG